MLPGSKFIFEMHYHAVGEESGSHQLAVKTSEAGRSREVLALFNTFTGGNRLLDIAPNQVTTTGSFVVLRENARLENFRPTCTCAARACRWTRFTPTAARC
jgi:hypothetical protein